MPHNDAAIEKEIQAKGLNAPRLTPADIDACIVGEAYHRFEGTTLIVCALALRNGFTVTGESAAASRRTSTAQSARRSPARRRARRSGALRATSSGRSCTGSRKAPRPPASSLSSSRPTPATASAAGPRP